MHGEVSPIKYIYIELIIFEIYKLIVVKNVNSLH